MATTRGLHPPAWTMLGSGAQSGERRRIGGKAHGLARLAAAGFPVPAGHVIDVETLSAWVPGTTPPEPVVGAVRRAIELLGDGPLAVRSSAVDEDDPTASHAGIYTTTLDVRGEAGVLDAVSATLTSRLAAPSTSYSGSTPPAMAVLVQAMLTPEVAGVAFTADPVSGDRGTVRVSGVRGIGAAVGSGEVTPDEWDVTDGVVGRRPDAGTAALSADQVRLVAEVAGRIEESLGAPQDVEWAIVNGEVIILQSRPITALPVPPRAGLDGANWEKDLAHHPEPLSPFGWSITPDGERIAGVFAAFGLVIDRLEDRLIGGEVYVRPMPVVGSANSTAKPPPAWVLGLAARLVPALRRRMRAAQAAIDVGLETWPSLWESVERDQFLTRIDALRSVDVASLDTGAFVAHLDEIRTLAADGAESHFKVAIPYFVFLHHLDTLMASTLGWTFDRTVSLLASPASTAAAGLGKIRAAVAVDERLRAALDASPSDPVGAVGGVDPSLALHLREWLDVHGWRTAGYDAGSPALIERPGLVTRLLTTPESAMARRDDESALDAAISGLPAGDRQQLMEALDLARWVYPMREDNVIIVDNVPSGLARRWLLEAASRLMERGLIARRDDAPYLEATEIIEALEEPVDPQSALDLRSMATRRRAEWAWTRAHPGPVIVGERTQPPDLSRLPEAGRRINEALLWAMAHEYPGDVQKEAKLGLLPGSPGSPGVYRGAVRVVRGEADFAKLRAGEVLVCPATTPAWAVLFPMAGALVTDGGGVLSHAAIVAREHGIPAVLGTRVGTGRLRDGLFVEVDGSAGVVRLL